MEQKRVSFKVAKAIKEAGYPQNSTWWYSPDGRVGDVIPDPEDFAAPTYLDVWLWLWREKSIELDVEYSPKRLSWYCWHEDFPLGNNCKDQEEAIIAAIEHLVDNGLIK